MRTVTSQFMTLAFAAFLLGACTLSHQILDARVGPVSPFMLYVAAVLIAAFARGAACGLIVLIGGGVTGYYLFGAGGWEPQPAAFVAVAIYGLVGSLVLLTAYLLRAQINGVFDAMRRRLEEDM